MIIFYLVGSSLHRVRAVVSKRGVDDGNQKGGSSLQPAQESHFYFSKKKNKSKRTNFLTAIQTVEGLLEKIH